MGADAGTLAVLEDKRQYNVRRIALSWQTGAGVGTFEKSIAPNPGLRGRLLQIAAAPGGTPPTALSDLAIFLAEEDTTQADAIVTAAGEGVDLITTAFKKKVLAIPNAVVFGAVRLQITNNAVPNANGTIWLYIEELGKSG